MESIACGVHASWLLLSSDLCCDEWSMTGCYVRHACVYASWSRLGAQFEYAYEHADGDCFLQLLWLHWRFIEQAVKTGPYLLL